MLLAFSITQNLLVTYWLISFWKFLAKFAKFHMRCFKNLLKDCIPLKLDVNLIATAFSLSCISRKRRTFISITGNKTHCRLESNVLIRVELHFSHQKSPPWQHWTVWTTPSRLVSRSHAEMEHLESTKVVWISHIQVAQSVSVHLLHTKICNIPQTRETEVQLVSQRKPISWIHCHTRARTETDKLTPLLLNLLSWHKWLIAASLHCVQSHRTACSTSRSTLQLRYTTGYLHQFYDT